MRIVIINGYPGAGKDTFIDFCEKYGRVGRLSSVDRVKRALEILGWDDIKTPEVRKALSDLKDISTKLFDGPFKYVTKQLQGLEYAGAEISFVHAREPAELRRYRDELGAIIIFIARQPSEVPNNHADQNVESFDYDMIIDNSRTLNDLDAQAREFMKTMRGA